MNGGRRDTACGIDRDTTCAIVGGIVVLSAPGGVPSAWVRAAEPLPESNEEAP